MKSGVRLAVILAVASFPAAAQADVVTPKVVAPHVVTPTVTAPTVTPPQVNAPNTPSPAPAPTPPPAPSPSTDPMINLGENPAPGQIPAQYVSGNPTPRPEPGWGAVKQAHDDLAFKLENESLLAPLHGAIAEQTINDVLSSLGWADAADPGGIADIIDSVFGTAAGHRSLDDGAPTSQQ